VYATYVDHLAGGRVPYADTYFDYPPAIGYLAGLFSRVSDGPVVYVALWTVIAAAASGGVAYLLAREGTPARTLLFWSGSPQLLLYGGANFDVLAVFTLVVAVVLARRGRHMAALIALGIASLVKVFPVVAAGLELERARRARGIRAALALSTAFAATVAIGAAPSLAAPHPSTEGIVVQASRTNFDSVWGLVLAALDGLHVPGAGTLVGALSLVGLLSTYLFVLRRAEPRADPARLTLLGLLALLLWTRLYSPQYSLWVLPFFALLPVRPRPFALLSIADIAVFAALYPLTLVPWGRDDTLPSILFGVLAVGVVLRHVALIGTWWAANDIGPAQPAHHPGSSASSTSITGMPSRTG